MSPPKKKKRSTIFGGIVLTRGPNTDTVNCDGRKKPCSSQCWLPLMSDFLSCLHGNLRAPPPNATHPKKYGLIKGLLTTNVLPPSIQNLFTNQLSSSV